jgi:hypothetical protein
MKKVSVHLAFFYCYKCIIFISIKNDQKHLPDTVINTTDRKKTRRYNPHEVWDSRIY